MFRFYRFMFLAMASLVALTHRTDDPAPGDDPEADRPMSRRDFRAEVAKQVEAAKSQLELIELITTLRHENYQFRTSKHRLTAEQHADWLAYQALGKPAEVQQKIAAVPTLESELDKYRKAEKIANVASKAKISNTEGLAALLGDQEFEIVEIPGADPQVLVVEGQNKTPIREFIKNNPRLSWAEPALFTTDTAAQGTADTTTTPAHGAGQQPTTPPAHGAAYIPQPAGTPPAAHGAIDGAALADEFNKQRNAGRVNPLAK